MQDAPSHEDRLLGGLLVGLIHWPGAIEPSLSVLEPLHFRSRSNFLIFDTIVALRRAGLTVDLVTVCDRLRGTGRVDPAGGAVRLAELWEWACRPSDVPALTEAIIRQRHSVPGDAADDGTR